MFKRLLLAAAVAVALSTAVGCLFRDHNRCNDRYDDRYGDCRR